MRRTHRSNRASERRGPSPLASVKERVQSIAPRANPVELETVSEVGPLLLLVVLVLIVPLVGAT